MSKSFLFQPLAAALLVALSLPTVAAAQDEGHKKAPLKPAIVLAAFGTSEVDALESILNVEKKVREAFPGYDVHLAFTSNIIRNIWHHRAKETKFKSENKIPAEIYTITNPLTTLALLQEEGPRPIMVQSLHITNGSEFDHLKSIVDQLNGIKVLQESKKPFPSLALGESALGNGDQANLDRAAKALESLVTMAKADGSALVLMGHGNEHKDVKSYRDFAAAMNKMYGHPIFLGLVEGSPEFDDVLAELKKANVKKVLLAPFMLVAGDHAKNDMAGDEEDSWATMLKAEGITVKTHVQGLGAIDAWADIYVERLKALEGSLKK